MQNRQIHIVELPKDKLGPEHFRLAEGQVPQAKDGELLLKTKLISLDAANRAWMQGATYRAAIEAGAHYIDLADARDFVAGFGALDDEAKAHDRKPHHSLRAGAECDVDAVDALPIAAKFVEHSLRQCRCAAGSRNGKHAVRLRLATFNEALPPLNRQRIRPCQTVVRPREMQPRQRRAQFAALLHIRPPRRQAGEIRHQRRRPPGERPPRLPVARTHGQGALHPLRRQMFEQPEEEVEDEDLR